MRDKGLLFEKIMAWPKRSDLDWPPITLGELSPRIGPQNPMGMLIPHSWEDSDLVGGLEHVLCSPIVGMMIQSDELHHFSEG